MMGRGTAQKFLDKNKFEKISASVGFIKKKLMCKDVTNYKSCFIFQAMNYLIQRSMLHTHTVTI